MAELSTSLETQPADELARFLGFEPHFYRARSGISTGDALAHFMAIGRFENRLVRKFAPSNLAVAVGFDADAYNEINGDVREARVDPWCHFLEYGVREGRATMRRPPPEDAFWAALRTSDWRLLTVREKTAQIEASTTCQRRTAVIEALSNHGQALYRSPLARYLAKASLMLGWPAVAAAFLSSYREGLPFCLPDTMASSETTQVYDAMPLRAYCEMSNLQHGSVSSARADEIRPGTDAVVACLPDAIVHPDGHVVTRDRILLTDVSWSGPMPVALRALIGPRHRALTLARDLRRIPGTSASLLRRGSSSAFALVVDALPRLLVGLETVDQTTASSQIEVWFRRTMNRGHVHSSSQGSVTCLAASSHADLAREILPKIEAGLNVRLALDTSVDGGCQAETLIALGAPRDQADDVVGPPFAARFEQLRDMCSDWTSTTVGGGIFLRSDSPAVSGIANGDHIEACARELGMTRVVPDWRDGDMLKSTVSEAQIIMLGSAADAAALLFARPATPIVLLGQRSREFDAIASVSAVVGANVSIVRGLSTGEAFEPEDVIAFLSEADVKSALEQALGGDVVDAFLRRRLASVAATARAARPDEVLDILNREAGWLYRKSAAVGRFCFDPQLDAICSEFGNRAWHAQSAGGPARPRVRAYYATELVRIGGHTRLIEDLIAARPEDEHHVICSGMPDIDAGCSRDLIFRPQGTATMHLLPLELNARLTAATSLLHEIRPATLFQLAHPDDPVGTAILNQQAADQLVLVHHNDHSFCFGPTRSGLIHLTVHARSKREVEKSLGVRAVCASMTSQAGGRTIDWQAGEPLLTLTTGSEGKFASRQGLSYADLVTVRLTAREGRHVHVGPLDPSFLGKLERRLASHGVGGRLDHIQFTADVPGLLLALRPHLYLNSFPVGGGRALVDAMAVGLPIGTGHYDINLDSSEVPYAGHLRWTHFGEMSRVLQDFSAEARSRHQTLALRHFQSVHSPDHFRHVITGVLGRASGAAA